MASKKQVTILYLYTELLCFISVIFAATIIKDNLDLPVPSTAGIGHIITKLGCSEVGISLQINGIHSDEELFFKLFSIDNSGNLVVKSDLSPYEDKYFPVSVFSDNSCFSNVPFKREIGILIQNSNEYLPLEHRIYKGSLKKYPEPGNIVTGLENVLNSKFSCVLNGEQSEFFSITTSGIRLVSQLPTEIKELCFTLQCYNGKSHGHAVVHISKPEDVQNNAEKLADFAINQNHLVQAFDQEDVSGHRRFRREIKPENKGLTVQEGKTNILTLDSPQPGQTLKWSITQDDTNTFQITQAGLLSVRSGKTLDYDKGPRQYTIGIDVKSFDGSTVLKIWQVNIQVTDENDELPVITNHPRPFQATVDFIVSPGTQVYQMKAVDVDLGSQVQFFIDGTNDLFDIEINSGWIKTKQSLEQNREYTVRVYAKDTAASTEQRSSTETVTVYTKFLPPQFNETRYTAVVQEFNQPDQTFDTLSPAGQLSLVYAINFQRDLGGNTEYTVLDNNAVSTKFKIDSTGHLVTLTPLDYETDPKTFNLRIQAVDTHSQTKSFVNLTVTLEDRNEYDPTFTLSTYVQRIREDLAINSPVLTVSATDQDLNSVLRFWVSNPNFKVQSLTSTSGQLQVNSTLDYDRQQSHRYEFDVYVEDNGVPPRRSQAKILIDLINVNDEHPQFQNPNMVATIKDNIVGGTNVYLVQAVDLDGDGVTYSFENNALIKDIFAIDDRTGRITYRQSVSIPADKDQYLLTVIAKDDGTCCSTFGPNLSSTATLTVNIVDAVNTKPSFTQCSTYAPSVKEEQPPGVSVFTVSATDDNRGENSQVDYYAVTPTNNQPVYFAINQTTGVLTTTQTLDRESFGSKYLFFTVRAVDRGQPPGVDYCTFPISITDVNDNNPEFGGSSSKGSVLRTAAIGYTVMTVKATDKDIGVNGEVNYSEVSTTEFFVINPETGAITVAKSLINAPNNITFTVQATDKGIPPRNSTLMTIAISVTTDDGGKPPIWSTPNPIFSVNETAPLDTLVGSLIAESQITGSSGVTFTLISNGMAGSQVKPFRISTSINNPNQVNILILDPLDYEKVTEYKDYLQLRAKDKDNEVYTDIFPLITVIDQNDEIPSFAGVDPLTTYIEAAVTENQPAGVVVATVAATDEDIDPRFKQLRYSLFGNMAQNFSINQATGQITTRSTFDREATSNHYYLLSVQVDDTAPSARPSMNGNPNTATAVVRVKISDVNDNQPYFEQPLYKGEVKEDSFISSVVMSIEAKDLDEATFTYSIDQNSPGANLFSVNTRQKVGEIVVAGNLDYETGPQKYNLTVVVDDGLYTARTVVEIAIIDVNDNPPVFTQSSYVIRNVTEEFLYSVANPLRLLQANATDPDKFRDIGIEYRISDEDAVINSLFTIDATSGQLSLIGKLDRDRPNGREVYQFNILAIDEPGAQTRLTGYATVQIYPLDINDNSPRFTPENPVGSVAENSPTGTSVMTVLADDYDAGDNAKYTLEMVGIPTPRNAFRIQPDGQVFTIVSDLDREVEARFTFIVKATDKGEPPQSNSTTVTINIKDVNDNVPEFEKKIYTVTIPETHTGTVVIIKANDPDVDDTLTYSLNNDAYKHFIITSQGREGIIGVYNGSNIDYENGDRSFNLTATVSDGKHQDTTKIEITIEDVNDETPKFTVQNVEKHFTEGSATPIGAEIATFTATDRDTGDNGKIKYFISKTPYDQEPRAYFELEDIPNPGQQPSTRVKLRKLLDRETISRHEVRILAIDSGYPELTGTATLTVYVDDVNDEYPRLRNSYASILENTPPAKVTTVFGDDPDLPENGPPFGFSGIPCTNSGDQCKFDVNFIPSLDNNNGGADIMSKQSFDRELQKFYYLPIIMWDQRGKQNAVSVTGTNTLTIEIKDVNDNPHGPGTQTIHVYNYKGLFKNIPIGAVNYEDLDDSDIGDKTFTYKGPADYKNFFSVDLNSGMVTLLHGGLLGKWEFQVDVFDRVDGLTTTSTVIVNIEELPEEAPYKSGSVRLKGTTPEKFIEKDSKGDSPYSKFRKRLSTSLNTDVENVEMISILSPKTDYTDVRFSAHGSPYYSPTKMNGAILKDKAGFAQDTGATIEMINIDECLKETCESGCYNYLNVTGKPNLVNIRGSSVVGVETFVQGKCGCHETVSQTECDATYCYNGGTCQKDYWNVLSCKCLAGFDGPRCQSTRHTFDGTGYALYKPLEQCENSETSLEFITTQENGLLLYLGPVADNTEPADFLSLELLGGKPILKIDHGSGSKTLTIDSPALNGGAKLSDGKWHHINIIRRGKLITMTVDYCKDAQPSTDSFVDNRSACEVMGSTPGENMFLNVNAPLQMGGRYTNTPAGITTNKFNGCVRNLRHNKELYDLYTGSGTYPGSMDGCAREDDACNKNSINLPKKCGDNGDCQLVDYTSQATVCICHSGYRGDSCEKVTTVRDLRTTDSYMDWMLTTAFQSLLSQWETDVHVMYRTRDTDGVIFHVSSTISAEFIRLEIVTNRLQILYNLGDGNHKVSLDKVVASDGQWHKIKIQRRGKFLSLSMDTGEGIHYADTYGPDYGHHLLEIKSNQIYAGGSIDYSHSTITVEKDLNSTCLNDIRLANAWFPMTTAESTENINVKLSSQRNTVDGCVRDDCANVNCAPLVCRPLWEAYECVCPLHHIKVGAKCEIIDYCGLYSPCHPDATCINDPDVIDYGYKCVCHGEWTGRTCFTAPIIGEDTSSAALEIIIPVVILLVLIVLIVGFLLWWKCRNQEDVLIEDEKEDYEVRENVMDYDEEGAGEDDYEGHIQGLGRLPDPSHFDKPVRVDHLGRGAPPGGPGIGDFIGDRLDDANDDSGAPPYDTLKEFDFEGEGSDAGSLSSLNTSTSGGDQDYDYLNEWGPKFAKLADMYNNPNYEDSD